MDQEDRELSGVIGIVTALFMNTDVLMSRLSFAVSV
jgi:hypothetical protein